MYRAPIKASGIECCSCALDDSGIVVHLKMTQTKASSLFIREILQSTVIESVLIAY